jgi:hypothetical protein
VTVKPLWAEWRVLLREIFFTRHHIAIECGTPQVQRSIMKVFVEICKTSINDLIPIALLFELKLFFSHAIVYIILPIKTRLSLLCCCRCDFDNLSQLIIPPFMSFQAKSGQCHNGTLSFQYLHQSIPASRSDGTRPAVVNDALISLLHNMSLIQHILCIAECDSPMIAPYFNSVS